MRISEIIANSKDNFGILGILSDKEFCSFGLSSSDLDVHFCTFINNVKYLNNISPNVKMIITTSKISKLVKNLGVCISQNPKITFFKLHNFLQNDYSYSRIKFESNVGKNCKISKLVNISKENVKIGNNVIIEDFVVIKENTIVGDNTIIRTGSIIGGEGFEFRKEESEVFSVKHLGGIKIGENVEIQYNTCIDKAVYPWDNTIIGDYSKIDNLVQIGHAVKIGKRCLIAGNSLIGGRTVIGDGVWIGPGVTISNGIEIGNNARVNLGSVVVSNVRNNESVTGNFAINTRKFLKHVKGIELS